VVKPTIGNTAAPTVSDASPELGQTLTAVPGSWSPSDGLTFGFQWLRGTSPIGGATGSTYTTVASDVGQQLRVVVTASRPGYQDGTAQSALTAAVVDPDAVVEMVTPPSISGTAAVGSLLTATGGTWNPPDATRAYQWFRGSTAIVGATAATYTPVAADVGQPLRVRVTASKAGMQAASADSAPTATVVPGRITAPKPKIAGTPKVGKVLTAKAGASTPRTVKVTYQWLRNGKAIKKAKKSKYKLARADKGKKISVRVTRTAPGYRKSVLTSGVTRKIR
jgi:hypothetical protein